MKDITDYFKSSPDDEEVSQSTPKSKERPTKGRKVSANGDEGLLNTPKKKNSSTKSKKTPRGINKISPVRSPLEAYNLLFNIDKGVTDKGLSTVKNISKMERNNIIEIEESNSHDCELSPELQETSEDTRSNESKVNAFQFLMMGRNKVIGTNSPGKELAQQDTAPKSSEKLSARKRLLSSWSDSIQAKKRKICDDEVDKYIKVKLMTRKERLKSLLHIDDNSDNKIENSPKPKKKKLCFDNEKQKKSEKLVECSTPSNGSSKKVSKKIKKPSKIDIEKPNNMRTASLSSGDDFESNATKDTKTNTPKSEKIRKHKKKLKEVPNLPLTPKSKWKMKIKLVNHDCDDITSPRKGDEENNIKVIESENFVEEISAKTVSNSTIPSKTNEEDVIVVQTIDCQSVDKTEDKENGIISAKSEDIIEVSEDREDEVEIIDTITYSSRETATQEINNSGRVLRNRASLNVKRNVDYAYSSEDSDDEVKKKNNKKAIKIAPVFIKAMPKPKVDPAILEARRKFLMSEMPDELRKKIDRLPSNGHQEDIDFDVFPKISHINQEERNNPLWNLADPCLEIRTATPFIYEPSKLPCESLIDSYVTKSSLYEQSEPIKNIKTILINLKKEHSNYPVYKAFRLLKEKSGFKTEVTPKKTNPKRKTRKSMEKKENSCNSIEQPNNLKHLMWTEKYKPKSSEDFLGNIQAVSSLKKWLEKWRDVLESGKRKRKQYDSDSESEFMSSDAESVYDRSLSTTVILSGPCGSGKSSAVYAVCNELGLNVLELNASSKRTGKQVIQELQEATRSHQVRKKSVLESFTKKDIPTNSTKDVEKNKSRRMCVLLIEDIDIVFEQDEGFISAISQISASSKRPIVLTTSNENSAYAQKFLNEFKTIKFHSFTVKSLGVWLQILCVLEGIFVDLSSIGELLEYNKGDLRKTLLELQFWAQSGGQINKKNNLFEPIFEIDGSNEEDIFTSICDDAPSSKELYEQFENYRVHTNILSDFENFQSLKFNNIPNFIDLKTLWWNIPKFFLPSKPRPSETGHKKSKTKKRLKLVSDMLESAAIFDVSYRKIYYKSDRPVCTTRWQYQLQDSLELEENYSTCSASQDVLELNHYLTDSYLNRCKNRFIYESSEHRFLNMAVPGLQKEKQLNNDHKYEEELLRPVPLANSLDRKSVSLDYLPCLRTIARTECKRAKNNAKRHNRFYNYLQNLNIVCDTPILDFATRSFSGGSCLE